MFALHESTRQFLLRAFFVLLCLVPTAAVLAWCAAWESPSHLKICQAHLSELTGWPVTIAAVVHDGPGRSRYRQVEISDPDSGQVVAQINNLEVATGRLQLDRLDVGPHTRRWLAGVLATRLRCGAGRTMRISIDKLVASDLSLPPARAEIVLGSAHAKLELYLGDVEQPVELVAIRNREQTPPATTVQINTHRHALPCGLFSPLVAAEDWLGADSTFQGYADLHSGPDTWQAQIIRGRLDGVDLERLVTDRFAPHVLGGTARIDLERAVIRDGRCQSARGQLRAGGDASEPEVSVSLLAAATHWWNFRWLPVTQPESPRLRYTRLHLRFACDASRLELSGDPHEGGAVFVGTSETLLMSTGAVVAPVTLAHVLCDQGQAENSWAPWTPSAGQLLGRLPFAADKSQPSQPSQTSSAVARQPGGRARE